MVMTSERVCGVMIVLGFTEGAVSVEEEDKGNGWCVSVSDSPKFCFNVTGGIDTIDTSDVGTSDVAVLVDTT